MSDKASRFISALFYNYDLSWSMLHEFRNISAVGLSNAEDPVLKQKIKLTNSLMFDSQMSDFIDQEKLKAKYNLYEFAQISAKAAMTTAKASIQSASVIFAYTIFDTCLNDLCRVTSLKYLDRWDDVLKAKNIQLFEAKLKSYDELQEEQIEKHLKGLDNESIFKRMDFIRGRCRAKQWEPMEGFQFNQQKIETFNTLRNDIVHGRLSPNKVNEQELDVELTYIEKTGLYFITMVLHYYDLKVDILDAMESGMISNDKIKEFGRT